jgi:hypothetical protein
MLLHFAYGSNMSRALMRPRCPNAVALGTARLADWRFVIARAGYASVVPAAGDVVHGVVWDLSARDVAAINAYEGLHAGLYRRRMLPVRLDGDGRRVRALTYVASDAAAGRPRPGYLGVVLAAARDWDLPADYVARLRRFAPSRWRGARAAETGEVA